jgi:hypothetical protein
LFVVKFVFWFHAFFLVPEQNGDKRKAIMAKSPLSEPYLAVYSNVLAYKGVSILMPKLQI